MAADENVEICPPSSSSFLFALKTMTNAFHLIKDLILLSIKRSPGIDACSLTGIEFLNGVVKLYEGMAPSCVNLFASFDNRNEALSIPSSSITLLIASSHSCVSIGSKSFSFKISLLKI